MQRFTKSRDDLKQFRRSTKFSRDGGYRARRAVADRLELDSFAEDDEPFVPFWARDEGPLPDVTVPR